MRWAHHVVVYCRRCGWTRVGPAGHAAHVDRYLHAVDHHGTEVVPHGMFSTHLHRNRLDPQPLSLF